MLHPDLLRVGYVVKRYPRFSETFIVNEILAHEESGLEVDIFSLRPPVDSHFQDAISRVRAGLTYLPEKSVRAAEMWSALNDTGTVIPGFWEALGQVGHEDWRDVYQAAVMARHARERGIGHLHAHFGSSAATVTRLAAHFAGLPYSFTAHAKDIFHESVSAEGLRRNLREAAAVVTVSDYNVDFLRSSFAAEAARVQRIYNGLDLDRFPFRSPAVRSRKVVAVGRLVEKKGFDVLVDACAILANQGIEFTCQIVGTGELEADLRTQIQRLGLSSYVELTGPRPQREVIELIRKAAVFTAPCVEGSDGNRDGLPTVLLESMALGTPSISTDVTGIPEVLQHLKTGLMVRQHDPESLAHAMRQLLDDAERRVRLAGQARQVIERDFDIHRNAAQLRSVFANVLSTRHLFGTDGQEADQLLSRIGLAGAERAIVQEIGATTS